ncbi:hypothetical protein HHI36_007492 [Cryptolaemus montrouzieri]|uniref:G-protein coupled receptors family 3 profile domain-containing protein n=1 Tax=Cryptolaemus montrouzieri TaxID=559131 RepID=A0ABD2MQI7_9CUCU
MIFVYFVFFLIFGQSFTASESYQNESDLDIAVILSSCDDSISDFTKTWIDAALWIVDRLNILEVFQKLKLGVQIHKACTDENYFQILFDIHKSSKQKFVIGVVSDRPVSLDVKKLADIFDLKLKNVVPDLRFLMKGAVQVLEILNWTQNLTVLSPDKKLVDEFFKYARAKLLCVKKTIFYKYNFTYELDGDESPFIILGRHDQITDFLNYNMLLQDLPLLVVPTDGSIINDIGENAYIILPSHVPLTDTGENVRSIPSQLLFEIAQPILSYTEYLGTFLKVHCNETWHKLFCIKYKKIQFSEQWTHYTNDIILKILKIEPLKNNFVYDIYKVENDSEAFFKMEYDFKQSLRKSFVYNIFDDTLTSLYKLPSTNISNNICLKDAALCEILCENFQAVFLMYSSTALFSIKENSYTDNILCLLKALWTTLSMCGAFSVILSRCILLSTVTKEITYMSHIPGSVQSFLALFILGVQAALSLQVLENCQKVFEVILITICWCFWISCYKVLNDSWKEPLICFAMNSTASILLGVIFLPRTYLMNVSSRRNKIRTNLAHLNGRNNALETYRANARQTYDCVNVAAINAISVARAGIISTDLDEDIYNYPTLPRDEELNFEIQTTSSSYVDKVTRF